MITIEKFYFDAEEAIENICGGSYSDDYHITFVGESGELNIEITVRGAEEFKKVIQNIYDLGMGLTGEHD